MNLAMQEVLIKFICATQRHLDIPNYKFDELLFILDHTFDYLKSQAPTTEAYDSLSRKINLSIYRMFECLFELNSDQFLHRRRVHPMQEGEKTKQYNNKLFNGNLSHISLS